MLKSTALLNNLARTSIRSLNHLRSYSINYKIKASDEEVIAKKIETSK